jgi:hypothetical protein
MGGAAALFSAWLLMCALNRWQPLVESHVVAGMDARVYLAGFTFSLLSALLFGLLPAWRAWQASPSQSLKNGDADTIRVGRFALRDLLLGLQIGICTLLVTSSLVAARGMQRALHLPLGFQPQGALLADVDLSEMQWTDDLVLQKQQAIAEAARSIPGVDSVGLVSRTPFTGGMHGIPVFRPGTTDFKLNNAVLAPYVFQMSPGYFDTAGTRLLSGRNIVWSDTTDKPFVAVVNRTFAQKMWGNTTAIGQRFVVTGHLTEVVGVVEDGKYHDLEESPQPVVYQPLSQYATADAIFVVRSQRAPAEMEAALLAAMRGIAMAAYSVSKRMKEFGIRVALGASKMQVIVAAVGRPIVVLSAGSALGLSSALLVNRLLGHIVYQANPRDPLVVGGVVLIMALLGTAASALPARRAVNVDPSILMRED